MGGAERILARAHELIAAGDDLLAVEILNKLVYAEPANEAARDLLADAFEQIGYQQESPSVRNSFLAAAFELGKERLCGKKVVGVLSGGNLTLSRYAQILGQVGQ